MKNKEEIWYCENSKGQKIAPYKPYNNSFEPKKNNKSWKLLIIITIIWLSSLVYFLHLA